MKVLMFSLEKKLLAPKKGDLSASQDLDRHIAYSEQVDKLTTIVVAKGNFRHQYVTPRFETYPTQAGPFFSYLVLKHYAKQVLAHEGFDLIVAQDILGFYAYLIAKKLHKPFFITVHGAWWDEDKHFRSLWRRLAFFLITYSIKRASGVRVVSEGIKQDLVSRGVNERKIFVIPPPVDTSCVTQAKKRDIAKLQRQYKDTSVLLYDGRLEEEKNVFFLLEVARRLSEQSVPCKLVLIGKGSQHQAFVDKAIAMNLFGTCIEVVDGIIDEMPVYYSIAKIFVMPSFSESFNKAIVKASAAGIPIVAIKNQGTLTTVQDGKTGFLIERGDAQNFTKKIQLLLNQEQKRIAMGEAGKQFAEHMFQFETTVLAITAAWKHTYEQQQTKKRQQPVKTILRRITVAQKRGNKQKNPNGSTIRKTTKKKQSKPASTTNLDDSSDS